MMSEDGPEYHRKVPTMAVRDWMAYKPGDLIRPRTIGKEHPSGKLGIVIAMDGEQAKAWVMWSQPTKSGDIIGEAMFWLIEPVPR